MLECLVLTLDVNGQVCVTYVTHPLHMRYTSVTYTDEPQGVDGGHFGDATRAGAAELDPYH